MDIDPQEFGELVGATKQNTKLLTEVRKDLKLMPEKIAEARMIAEEAKADAEEAKKKVDNVDNKIGVVAFRITLLIMSVVLGLGGWIYIK